jgi:hypothetical protein
LFGELFPETNDNLVAILLTYATARILLAGDAAAREEDMASAATRGLKRSSRFETTKQFEVKFRALLTEEASKVQLTLG